MVLGDSGKRLSKRDGAEDILEYKNKGYLQEALVNYLVRLGWTHGEEEIFSLDHLKEIFKLSDVNSSPAKFSLDLSNENLICKILDYDECKKLGMNAF